MCSAGGSPDRHSTMDEVEHPGDLENHIMRELGFAVTAVGDEMHGAARERLRLRERRRSEGTHDRKRKRKERPEDLHDHA